MRGPRFWLTIPFLLPQALHVRRTAVRFDGAAGPTEGSVGNGERRMLLALGDSIIAGVGASVMTRALVGQTASHLAELGPAQVDWQAFGHSGFSTRTFLEHYENRWPDSDPDYILISLGVNDITSLTTGARWTERLRRMLSLCRQHYPHAAIALVGIPPFRIFPALPEPLRTVMGRRGEAFDELGKSVVGEFPRAVHVPVGADLGDELFSGDGFHPSEEGYDEFGRGVAAALLGIGSMRASPDAR